MSAEDLNVVRSDLELLPGKEVKDPPIPVDIAIQESEDLYSWCRPDKAEFLKLGLTEEFLDSLLIRAGALREAQSLWIAKRNEMEKAQKKWLDESKPAYKLHRQMLHDFHYAYRNDEKIKKKLRVISKDYGHADMIQDLSDLSVIGRENPESLRVINYDMSFLDRASVTADNLSRTLADSRAEGGYNEAMDLRNRAYAYLKLVVDEVRIAGRHLFWENENKLKGYRSEYRYQANHSRKKKDNIE